MYENRPVFPLGRGSALPPLPLTILAFEAQRRSHSSKEGTRNQVPTRQPRYLKESAAWNATSKEKQDGTSLVFVAGLDSIQNWSLLACRGRSVRFFDPASIFVLTWTSAWASSLPCSVSTETLSIGCHFRQTRIDGRPTSEPESALISFIRISRLSKMAKGSI